MIYNIRLFYSAMDEISKLLLVKIKQNKEILADYKIFVGNTRLKFALQNALLSISEANSTIMPDIISIQDFKNIIINDIDTYNVISTTTQFTNIFKATVSKQERSFILSQLISRKNSSLSIEKSIIIAEQLGDLLDRSYLEKIDLSNLENLFTLKHTVSKYWQEILEFLNIITIYWPRILKEDLGKIDEVYQRVKYYQLQTCLWSVSPPSNIIFINIASYYPDVLKMLCSALKNSNYNHAYFYGLDTKLISNLMHTKLQQDEQLNFYHPQHINYYTFKYAKLDIDNVLDFHEYSSFDISLQNQKQDILFKIFTPFLKKDASLELVEKLAENISIFELNNLNEEAQTIALIMRKTIEEEKTVALITNNKSRAKRV